LAIEVVKLLVKLLMKLYQKGLGRQVVNSCSLANKKINSASASHCITHVLGGELKLTKKAV
jgi:hypothetical protein